MHAEALEVDSRGFRRWPEDVLLEVAIIRRQSRLALKDVLLSAPDDGELLR
jgi:hypothetical protein